MWLFISYILTVPIVIISTLYFYFQYRFTYWKRQGVPYVEPSFPLGNGHDLITGKINFALHGDKMYQALKKLSSDYGGFYMLHRPVFLPMQPELIKTILTKEFNNFNSRGFYYDEQYDPLSGHLVNLDGNTWKNIRAKITPTFTSGKMKMMFQTLLDCSKELKQMLVEPAEKGLPIDITDVFARLTTDNIGSCAFGLECNSLREPDAEFRRYGKLFVSTSLSNALKNVLSINMPNVFRFFRIPIINTEVSKFFLSAITDTVNYRERTGTKRNDFIDLLIKIKNSNDDHKDQDPITFNQLAAQAFVFFVGGFETSSTTMIFCFWELAQHPNIQNKLRDEIYDVLQRHKGEFSYEAITEMSYMDKVIHETLRKYPPIPLLNRRCEEDFRIPGTKSTIPRGAGVWISTFSMHRDPEYYPDPDIFDPERFSEEEVAKRHPFTYLPFGEGPRFCVGQRFAMMQIKIAIGQLLRYYSFKLHDDTILPLKFSNIGIFLAPKNNIYLRATKVQRNNISSE